MALGKHNVRVKVLAEKIARDARQRARRAGHRLCARGQRESAVGSHALSRDDHGFRCGVRGGARIGRAQPQARRLPRHRVSRRSRRLSEGPAESRRRGSTANGRRPSARAHAIVEYYAVTQSAVRAGAARSAATATTRSARTRGSPTRRSRSPSIRSLVRSERLQSGAKLTRRRRCLRRSRAARAPSSASSASTRSSPGPSMRSAKPSPDADIIGAVDFLLHRYRTPGIVRDLATPTRALLVLAFVGLAIAAAMVAAQGPGTSPVTPARGRHHSRHAAGRRSGQSVQRDRRATR